MKLIIDISDHIYSMVTNTGTFGCYRFNTSKAIRHGVPLDKLRAEIESASHGKWYVGRIDGKSEEVLLLDEVLQIIDKYRNEVGK